MKKYLLFILTVLLVFNVGSSVQPNQIDISLMTLNSMIYDYFSKNYTSENSFKATYPWLLSYEKNRILLFNHQRIADFQIIESFPATNHFTQQKSSANVIMPNFNDISQHFENYKPLYLHLDPDINNLNTLTDTDRIELISLLTQKQYISYMQRYNRELLSINPILYPLRNVNNIVLSTIEYNKLLEAYQKAKENKTDDVLQILREFYAIRLRRWQSQNAFVQTYELSQEKILGLSYFKSIELLGYLEDIAKHEQMTSQIRRRGLRAMRSDEVIPRNRHNSFINSINLIQIIDTKLNSIYENDLIAINSMTNNKAENKGFLITSLYDYLNWDYTPESTRDNFHVFLGNKLEMRTTEIDSIYNSLIGSTEFSMLSVKTNDMVEQYNRLENKNDNFNLQLYFDYYTNDFFDKNELQFINNESRSIYHPNTERYIIRNPYIEIDIKNQGFVYNLDRIEKNIQTDINTNLILSIDFVNHNFSELNESMKFNNLFYSSNNLRFIINSDGELSFKDGNLIIKLTPKLQYQVGEEYWDLIEELNRKLIARGVPGNWLANNINHPEFRIYHSIVRHFTQMPEHQVGRGERDQNWYMRHFGVDEKVRKGADFRRTHRNTLLAAERRHGIHYELLMAIMAIESDYANPRWRGNFYTFPALVSQYILLPRRQRFAENELVALYLFTEKTNKDVYHFIGSFAGAAGWGQFIPSSMNNYFIDSNNNFYDVDIFSIDDTLHSIANYLHGNGLNRQNINNRQARFNAVRAYNQSDAYVRAVLYIYDELRRRR